MTLPPNCLPPENVTLPGDLVPCLGQPATAPSDTQPAAPFADLLAGVAPTTVTYTPPLTPTAQPVELASQPAVNALPTMYSSHFYATLLQPTTLADASVSPDEPAAEIVSADPEPASEDEGTLMLTYQLIAGQWVPQPVPPPADPQQPVTVPAEATAPGEALPQTAGVVRCTSRPNAQGRAISGNDFSTAPTQPDKTMAVPVAQGQTPRQPEATKPAENAAPSIPVAGGGAATPPVASTIANTPKLELPAAPKSETSPTNIAKVGTTPSAAGQSSPTNVAPDTVLAAAVTEPPRPANVPPVKFAAPGSMTPAETAPGGITPNDEQEKKTVVADVKGVKLTGRQVGTSTATRDYSMPYSAANKTSAPSLTALPQSPQTGGMQSGTTTPVAETSSVSFVQAPRLVQEIRAIADRISTIDRNTVEVRFDFNESDRLSVRVEYRDGTVHTTFRTDSESLRETIAREWQVQASGADNRAYRVAEPIFSSNPPAASTDLSQSNSGSGQSHSRSFEHQGSSHPSGHSQTGRSGSGASSTASNVPMPTVRPETSLHLHTFA